ncbi:pilin [Rhodanobacter sp. OK091]|uniref:pilin n=1 Tax=Rhodanobacter sp. OK091 TaxID=1881037 RepID=UPI000911060C|nr:pilin [Rhodanobacter sp. OK091]SHM11884.1 Tfp pilus assembly protein, major pilin PilA [Rhodanobacter sp. OK091]
MIVSRRLIMTAVLTAGVCIAGCHRGQSPAKVDAASIQRAQDQLSQPAWLRGHLPASTVGYIRIASPWGMLGAAPSGRPLDAVMASEQNLKAIAALRDALAKDKTLADAGATPYLLPLLADLRSPVEVAMIDPIGTMSPNTQMLVTMRMAQKSVVDLNARFAQFNAPALKLTAPLDSNGDGRLAIGTPLHFDVTSGRLFALASRQPVEPVTLTTLIVELAQTKPDSDAGKAIAAQEQQIDQSGQGTFAWISLHGLGGVAAGAIPAQSVGTLPGDLTSKAESVTFGAGTVDGHGRLRIVVHAPQARLLGYLAPTRFAPDFKVAGKPHWLVNFALPGGDQYKAFEDNLSLDFGVDRAGTVRNAEVTLQQKLGFSLSDLSRWIGPEIIGFEDDAGVYTAVRVNDRNALYEHLQALARRQNGSYRTQSMDGVEIHVLDFGHTAPDAAHADPRQQAWATLTARFGTHLYWIEDGDFLIFAKVPQALADRGAARLDTSLDAWLKSQAWQGKQNLLGFTTVSHDAQRNAYYGYLQMLQILGDLSGQSTDLLALPAAHTLKLPQEGVIGMNLGVTADDLSFNITYEQQPLEMLTGSSGSGSMTAVAAVAIVAAIAIPAYQDYIVRAQVTEGIVLMDGAKTALTEYHQQHGRWPTNNQQAGLPEPDAIKGRYVDSITVAADGEIQAHFSGRPPQQANVQLNGKTLSLTPLGSTWHCHSDDITAKYLPASCRQP